METVLSSPRPLPVSRWRDLVMPKEHGSWSLALEPLAFGLLIAPTTAGACFAVAAAAGFLSRRPLRIAFMDARAIRRAEARRILGWLALVAALGTGAAVALAGVAWLAWLAPAAVAGGLFAAFDRRNAGREEAAEVAGATAFALLPAAFAALAGASSLVAVAAAVAMIGRSVPTVLTIRAAVRTAKGAASRVTPAMAAALVALALLVTLGRIGAAPATSVVFAALFAGRTLGLLVFPRPVLRARTLGMIEGALGAVFVLVVGAAWNA